ncbi:MAG: response regulator, partial [Proteobacteria bacterium]|nr:response regulator [Pseudomonadota bacterium]
KLMLEKFGYSVTTVTDGQEAFNILTEKDFDVVLMDVQMPEMNGIEATKLIRGSTSLGAKSGIPIIAMTAYAMTGDREKFLAVGMNDYISKPVDFWSLKEVIERTMGKAQGPRS